MYMARPNPEGYVGGSEDFGFEAQAIHGHMGVNLETEGAIASDQVWRSNVRRPVEEDESGAFPHADHGTHEPYGPDVGN